MKAGATMSAAWNRTVAALLFGILMTCATSCSSPEPIYYTLRAMPGRVLVSRRLAVEVVRPGLAGYLDRSDIVLKQSDYKLDVDSQVRWGEPLADMVGRVLAQDLTQRLPSSSIFSGDGAIGADADVRVEVNVQQFNADTDGSVRLVANVAIVQRSSHTTLAAHSVSYHVDGVQPGPAGLASAMSLLLGELADQIGTDVART
jgi:uncharacterized lipoprotein YmbA